MNRRRWSRQRQYALRCERRGHVTPKSVVMAHYRNVTGQFITVPCGCRACWAANRSTVTWVTVVEPGQPRPEYGYPLPPGWKDVGTTEDTWTAPASSVRLAP